MGGWFTGSIGSGRIPCIWRALVVNWCLCGVSAHPFEWGIFEMRVLSLLIAVAVSISAAAGLSGCQGTSVPEVAMPERDPSVILAVGERAPDFAVEDHHGNPVRLADYRGRQNVVLIFYPVNETPGCTRQLCAARDAWDDYTAAEVQVFGVNPASAESHRAFAENHNFPFPLLVDTEEQVIRAYGTKGERHTQRTVYGIDKSGTIVFAERGMPETETILAAFGRRGG